jgi:uncharacterized protein
LMIGTYLCEIAAAYAAKYNHIEVVKYLTKDFYARHLGWSLRGAILGCNKEIILWLLEKGAICNSAHQHAATTGRVDIFEMFGRCSKHELDDSLCWAAMGGKMEMVKHLINLGADGIPRAIAFAKYYGYKEVVEYLQSLLPPVYKLEARYDIDRCRICAESDILSLKHIPA